MGRHGALEGSRTEDFAFTALRMAQEYAATTRREATIKDVEMALSWLCWFPFPGKPPQTPETKEAVAYLCSYGRKKRLSMFILPLTRDMPYIGPEIMNPMSLMVKTERLYDLGIDLSGVPEQRLFVAGVPTRAVRFGEIVSRMVKRY